VHETLRLRTVRTGVCALALVSALLVEAPGTAQASAAGAKGPAPVAPVPLAGVNVLGWGFSAPGAVASDGTHTWVANELGNSVTELDATTGAFVAVISRAADGFDGPDAVACDGTHVFVANYGGNSVTELDATTGALVGILSGPTYRFDLLQIDAIGRF